MKMPIFIMQVWTKASATLSWLEGVGGGGASKRQSPFTRARPVGAMLKSGMRSREKKNDGSGSRKAFNSGFKSKVVRAPAPVSGKTCRLRLGLRTFSALTH